MALPVQYREGGGNFVFNVDYFDWAQGAGYKRYYFLGTKDSVGNKYALTTDNSLLADDANVRLTGTASTDFDLVFNNSVTVANALCTASYTIEMDGTNSDSFTVAITVYHYDGSTETSLGTVTDTTTTDGDPAKRERRTVQFTLTEKKFSKGDTLRVTVDTTVNAGTSGQFYMDPAGSISFTGTSEQSINSSSEINIPFKIQQ